MSEHVTIYTDITGDEAADTMAALENLNIPYTLIDLSQNPTALERITVPGHHQTPYVETGTTNWSGFRPDLITALASTVTLDEYDVPTDPMDELGCHSCQ